MMPHEGSVRIPVLWHPRPIPLTPLAVAARGQAARQLAMRLLARDAAGLEAMQGATWQDVLIVLGDADALPWADGALYLGRDPLAPELLIPTAQQPSAPLPLLARTLRYAAPDLALPLAVLPTEGLLLSLSAARPIDRAVLRHWLETDTHGASTRPDALGRAT